MVNKLINIKQKNCVIYLINLNLRYDFKTCVRFWKRERNGACVGNETVVAIISTNQSRVNYLRLIILEPVTSRGSVLLPYKVLDCLLV